MTFAILLCRVSFLMIVNIVLPSCLRTIDHVSITEPRKVDPPEDVLKVVAVMEVVEDCQMTMDSIACSSVFIYTRGVVVPPHDGRVVAHIGGNDSILVKAAPIAPRAADGEAGFHGVDLNEGGVGLEDVGRVVAVVKGPTVPYAVIG